MKLYTLHRRQVVRRPLSEVFPFFAQPENLSLLTPRSLGFQMLTPSPVVMKQGTVIDYTIRVGGIPMRWTTLITEYDPPYRFVDVQIKGPYSYWHHAHTFAETDDGTLITDDVRYALPLGVVGRVVHALAVQRRLEHILSHRREIIDRLFSQCVGALP